MNPLYLRGVGIGLIIAWVTTALAYYLKGYSDVTTFIAFELVLSVIFIIASYLVKAKK